MLSSKDIEHKTIKHNRTIVETYTHSASGWRLKVWTSYSAQYKAMQTHIQEVKVDGSMELPIDGGIFKRVSSLKCSYFRTPLAPKWTYINLLNGEPAFDQSQPDYQDFELPVEDEYKLVTKMLEYCGIVIRETEVSQFGTAQQQHEEPTFSQQQ